MIIERERERPRMEIEEIRSPVISRVPAQEPVFTGFTGGPQKRSGFKLVLWMWTAALIDYLLILAGSLFALILFSMMVTQMQKSLDLASHFALIAMKTMLHPKKVNLTFLAIIISVGWTYFVVTRTFMGASIGEKFCGLRLGKPSERLSPFYVVRLMARTTFVVLTGVILIPVLSLIFRKDLAGRFSGGLHIYSLK